MRLPQTTRRSGFSAWIGDERMSTFVLSAPGQPPRQSELQRLKLLDAREPRPAEGPIDVPKVQLPCHGASCILSFLLQICVWVVMSPYRAQQGASAALGIMVMMHEPIASPVVTSFPRRCDCGFPSPSQKDLMSLSGSGSIV